MAEILGKEPETYACTLTAVEMARAAYRQAAHLSEFGVPILGVSCTCALATDRVKRGDHKVIFTLSPCASASNAGRFCFIQQLVFTCILAKHRMKRGDHKVIFI